MKQGETFVEGLTRILMLHNVIKEDEAQALVKGFKESGKANFDQFLLDEGLVSRTDLLNALSTYYNVPSFDVLGHFFDHQALHMFPKDFLHRNVIIPLEHDDNIMLMIAGNPQDPELLPRIGEYVSYDIVFNVGLDQDITDAISEFYDKSPADVRDPNEPEETPEEEYGQEHEQEPNFYKTNKDENS
ncbi:MAG: hypothetical protein AB7F19_01260 [Candidatus Babeliales bacterium]